jgi:hypothetical protein
MSEQTCENCQWFLLSHLPQFVSQDKGWCRKATSDIEEEALKVKTSYCDKWELKSEACRIAQSENR